MIVVIRVHTYQFNKWHIHCSSCFRKDRQWWIDMSSVGGSFSFFAFLILVYSLVKKSNLLMHHKNGKWLLLKRWKRYFSNNFVSCLSSRKYLTSFIKHTCTHPCIILIKICFWCLRKFTLVSFFPIFEKPWISCIFWWN